MSSTRLSRLGYERYGAQGGDWGAMITHELAQRYSDRIVAIHTNMPFVPFESMDMTDITPGKFWAWTDCDGHPERALTKDQMLDNVSVFWFGATGAASARLYWESLRQANRAPVTVPTGISIFPKEIFPISRRWAESRYLDLRYFNRLDRGGHFAAFEQPALFVDELRNFFRLLR